MASENVIHAIALPAPEQFVLEDPVVWNGNQIRPIDTRNADSSTNRPELFFDLSFEELIQRFETRPAIFVELDGSFVWREKIEPNLDWQIDGVISDRNEHVSQIEFKITLIRLPDEIVKPVSSKNRTGLDHLRWFLEQLNWPSKKIVFELVSAGLVVEDTSLFSIVETIRANIFCD